MTGAARDPVPAPACAATPNLLIVAQAGRLEYEAMILAASLPMLAAVLALATQIAIGALMLWPLLLALRKTDWSMRRATDGAEEIASRHADPMAA